MGMIDIHSHILPGVDDGADDLQESLGMLRIAVDDGVNVQFLTPHFHGNPDANRWERIVSTFRELKSAVADKGMSITLLLAGEVRLGAEIMRLVESEYAPWLGVLDKKKALLVDFPPDTIPSGAANLVKWLVKNGVQPVIAHPERHPYIQADIGKIGCCVDEGAVLQITSASLEGCFGRAGFKTALALLNRGWVFAIATDCHDVHDRPPRLSAGVKMAGDIIGRKAAEKLVTTVPERLLEGREVLA